MANTKSAKLMIGKIARRTAVNRRHRQQMRRAVSQAEQAISSGAGDAAELVKKAQPELMRAASRGVMHKNTARRKLSRMAKRLNQAAPTAS